MKIVNIYQVFNNSIEAQDIKTVEELLTSTDSKKDLVKHYALHNDLELFENLIPKLKSKGLIHSLENICENLREKDIRSELYKNPNKKIILTHETNKIYNSLKRETA